MLAVLAGGGCSHMPTLAPRPALVRLTRAELPAFSDDAHYSGLAPALRQSVAYLLRQPAGSALVFGEDRYDAAALARALEEFAGFIEQHPGPEALRDYVARHCRVYRSSGGDGAGRMLFTGYYEPEVEASPVLAGSFVYPVYGRPEDLVQVDLARFFTDPARHDTLFGRLEAGRLVPYHDRRAIVSEGALEGKARVLAWVADPVGLFFLQVQGSGRLRLPDGSTLGLHYDGTNGHPYRSIGKLLIEGGQIAESELSMQRIRAYLHAHPEQVEQVLNHNPSYVFFKPATGAPRGSLDLPLTAGRSLATDRRVFPPAALAYIETELPQVADSGMIVQWQRARRFVLNQDTGGAIRGPGRGDLFCGSGLHAETIAGHLRHPGRLFFIVPQP
jgi:membrane-bound lytic murein transglycosylase A